MGWQSASDGDAIHDNVAGEISAITEKTTPVDADLVIIEDSAAANAKKKVQVGNLPGGGGGGGGTGAGFLVGFGEDNLAAALTDSQLYRQIQTVQAQIPVTATHAGSVIGVSVASSEARTAGTATFEVFKNGTGTGLTCILNGTDTQYASAVQATGVDTFVAGDRLDVRVSTDGSWTPTTADVEAAITVTAPGAPTVSEWVEYLAARQDDETSHTDDDFFASDSSGDYTTQTVSGTASWSIGRGLLSAYADNQTASDASAYLKSITSASAPMTIETRMTWTHPEDDFPRCGIMFTDGTATTSNCVINCMQGSDVDLEGKTFKVSAGTLTDIQADVSVDYFGGSTNNFHLSDQGVWYMRLIWKSSNTWQASFSLDGVQWFNDGMANQSKTMTPTHIGFLLTTSGMNQTYFAKFDYLRVYDSDLSV